MADDAENAANIFFLTLGAVLYLGGIPGGVYVKITTVRLAPGLRSKLKVLAAARHQTMEIALGEAIDVWASMSVGRPKGKVSEEAKRMRLQCDQIAGSGNDRMIQAAMCALDCFTMAL